MILNTKQLEELEAIHDVVSEFDDSQSTSETYDDSIDSAFAWRRGMIEKAIQNVKKASRRFPEPNSNYPAGTLLYDQKQKRFARVSQAEPKMTLAYISSAAGALSAKNQKEDIPKPSKTKNAPKKGIAAQPSEVTSKPQKAQKKKPIAQKTKPVTPAIMQKATQAKKSKKQVANQAVPKKAAAAQKKKALAQPKHKPKASSAPKPKAAKAKPVFQKKKPIKKRAAPIARKSGFANTAFDPVADPNSYIKQHYKLMSNKELAEVTGLSEHTVRRKLGEWGLKRKP